jgi:hypothetical protein
MVAGGESKDMTRRLEGRDGDVWQAHLDGITQDKIARMFGISQPRVSRILAAVRESIPPVVLDDIRQTAADQIAVLYAETIGIMRAEHPLVSVQRGTIIVDPETGQRLMDDGPKLAAIGMAMRIQERVAKAYGTDAPAKVETTGTVKFILEGVDVDAI